MPSCNAGRVRQSMSDHMFNASRSIVKRNRLNLRMAAKEIAALIERHRMRHRLVHGPEFDSWGRDQVVHDAQPEFTLNKNIPCHQQIGMLGHSARQRVLDWNNGNAHRSAFEKIENFGGSGARYDDTAGQHALGRLVAERPELSLNRNFANRLHSGKVAGKSRAAQMVSCTALGTTPNSQPDFLLLRYLDKAPPFASLSAVS